MWCDPVVRSVAHRHPSIVAASADLRLLLLHWCCTAAAVDTPVATATGSSIKVVQHAPPVHAPCSTAAQLPALARMASA